MWTCRKVCVLIGRWWGRQRRRKNENGKMTDAVFMRRDELQPRHCIANATLWQTNGCIDALLLFLTTVAHLLTLSRLSIVGFHCQHEDDLLLLMMLNLFCVRKSHPSHWPSIGFLPKQGIPGMDNKKSLIAMRVKHTTEHSEVQYIDSMDIVTTT